MGIEALHDLKVLEYGEFISGPYCGKLLADLGAEVIKVEKPGFGDKSRSWGPFPDDIPHQERSGLFLYLNSNKLGATLNINSEVGLKIFRKLVKWADILVENNPPQEMEKLGLDFRNLHELNPLLVVTSITYFGQTGPYRDYKACDLISFGLGGEACFNPAGGVDDIERQPPLKGPAHVGEFIAGLTGAIGTMSAILARQATGIGQRVDLSHQEALASLTRQDISAYTSEGAIPSRTRSFAGDTLSSKESRVILMAFGDTFFPALMEMMGNTDWAKELESGTDLRTTILSVAKEWLSQKTNEEVLKEAQNRHVPMMPVQTVKETVNSEQLIARNYFVDIDHKEAGRFRYPGAPYKLSKSPWSIKYPAPLLGEHNEKVYCQMLGYSKQDLVMMRQAGVI